MKAFQYLIVMLAILLQVIVTGIFVRETNRQREMELADRLHQTLFETVNGTNEISFGRKVVRDLWRRLDQHPRGGLDLPKAVEQTRRFFLLPPLQAAILDDQDVPQATYPGDSSCLRSCLKPLDMRTHRGYGITVPLWRQERPQEYSTILSMAYSPKPVSGPRQTLFLGLDVGKLSRRQMLFREVALLRAQGLNVGWIDRINNTLFPARARSLFPRHQQMVNRYFNSTRHFLDIEGNLVVMMPFREHLVFWGIVPRSQGDFPTWSLLFLMFWLTLVLPYLKAAHQTSLADLLSTTLAVAAGLPLILTLLFWLYFTQNRTESFTAALFQEMEQTLINIDAAYPQTLRCLQSLLRSLSRQGETSRLNPAFQTHLNKLEAGGAFETLWLIASDGTHLRDISLVDPNVRFQFSKTPRERREKLQGFTNTGSVMAPKMVDLFMNFQPGTSPISLMWEYVPENREKKAKVRAGMSFLGKAMLQKFNQEKARQPVKEEASALVLGAVLDSQTGDLIQLGYVSLGNFLIFSAGGKDTLELYVDILKNSEDGRGEAAVVSTNDQRFCENLFLRKFFEKDTRRFPGLRFVAESTYSLSFFPETMKNRTFPKLIHQLVPPKTMISKVVWVKNRKFLLSAYLGANMRNYMLVAIKPWTAVRKNEADLLLTMSGLGLIISLLLGSIFWKLYQGMVVPAQGLMDGVRAMEKQDYQHRIALSTGDEWDEIARAFNTTLMNMEELQVARVVQRRLLPQQALVLPHCRFWGSNVMTEDVGGDYYDAFPCPDGSLLAVIGDVTGHGVAAALAVSMAKSAFQILTRRGIQSPAEILRELNRLILTSLGGRLKMTFQAFLVKPDRTLLFSSAGHPFPYLLRAGQAGLELANISMPLGFRLKTVYQDQAVSLENDDQILLYTDGLIEQDNPDQQEFLGHFQRLMAQNVLPREPQALVAFLQDELRQFSGTTSWADDVTIAVLKFRIP